MEFVVIILLSGQFVINLCKSILFLEDMLPIPIKNFCANIQVLIFQYPQNLLKWGYYFHQTNSNSRVIFINFKPIISFCFSILGLLLHPQSLVASLLNCIEQLQ